MTDSIKLKIKQPGLLHLFTDEDGKLQHEFTTETDEKNKKEKELKGIFSSILGNLDVNVIEVVNDE